MLSTVLSVIILLSFVSVFVFVVIILLSVVFLD